MVVRSGAPPGPSRSARVRAPLACVVALAAVAGAAETLPVFPAGAVWNQDIRSAPVHPQSSSMIATLAGLGGWGNLNRMQIDFSLRVVRAQPGAPTRTIVDAGGYFLPDCDPIGTAVPVPAGAAIEGTTGLTCDNGGEDCHLLVVQGDVLYEAWRVTEASPTQLESQCMVIWRLDAVYPPEGRGEHCTSADAAGFPMAPLLFNADEVAASLALDDTGGGDLGHAIRFILPNPRMAAGVYVRPATHSGGPSGPAETVPYGSRLRLRADFPVVEYEPAARVVLNTFKRYGIVLADGGNIALTAESDLYTTTKWDNLGIFPRVFNETPGATPVSVSDFQVLDTGPRIVETFDCVRLDLIYFDGFESGDTARWSSTIGE